MTCNYSSAEEAWRQATVSAATGGPGLADRCPRLIRDLAEGRVCSVSEGRDNERREIPAAVAAANAAESCVIAAQILAPCSFTKTIK